MSERFRDAPPRSMEEEEAEHGVLPHRSPSALLELIGEAQATDDKKKRKTLADQINELLVAMRAPGNEALEARTILTQLDLKTLDALEDSKGRLCHTEAMETLLACGFPHALGVKPEDLSFHNEERRRLDKLARVPLYNLAFTLFCFLVLPALSIAGVFGEGAQRHWVKFALSSVALGVFALWGLTLRRKKSKP